MQEAKATVKRFGDERRFKPRFEKYSTSRNTLKRLKGIDKFLLPYKALTVQ